MVTKPEANLYNAREIHEWDAEDLAEAKAIVVQWWESGRTTIKAFGSVREAMGQAEVTGLCALTRSVVYVRLEG